MNFTRVWGVLSLTFRDSIRAKWLILFSIVFFLLAIDIPDVVAAQTHILPASYLGTFLSTLIPLAFPIIPLLSLPMAATSIVDERESGTLQYILSNPISKAEFYLGRAAGLLFATTLAVIIGFGASAVFSYTTNYSEYSGMSLLIVYAAILNLIMLGLGLIVSNLSKRKVTALVTAIFVWLLFTAFSSVDQFVLVLNLKFGELAAMSLVFLDPIEICRILTVVLLGQPDQNWGNLGLLAYVYFGNSIPAMIDGLDATLAVWAAALFGLAFLIFNRQDVG